MFEPRLIKVACPHCGAGLKLNPQASVITCSYCQKSSFIHMPNRVDPPAPTNTQSYGHIHVSADQAKKAPLLIVAFAVFLPCILGGLALVLFFGIAPSKSHRTPPSPPTHAGQAHDADACNKAVACCKAMLGATGSSQHSRTCEALRALSDADCKKQHETFRGSARQLGQTCD